MYPYAGCGEVRRARARMYFVTDYTGNLYTLVPLPENTRYENSRLPIFTNHTSDC